MDGIYTDMHDVYTGDFSRMQGSPYFSMSFADWKAWVTERRQECSQRLNAARHTSGNGFSSSAFPTPTVPSSHCVGTMNEWGGSNNGLQDPDPINTNGSRHGRWGTPKDQTAQWQTPAADSFRTRGGNRKHELGLDRQAKQWPTASVTGNHNRKGVSATSGDGLSTAAKQWPTPRTITGGAENAERKKELGRENSGGGDLQAAAGKLLNPRWVETLLGLPVGWTMPSCADPQIPESTSSGYVEMVSYPRKPNSPSEHLREN
jgi:hypothetical protein